MIKYTDEVDCAILVRESVAQVEAALTADYVKSVTKLAELQMHYKKIVDEKTLELKTATDDLTKVSNITLPELMAAAGVAELVLLDGSKVTITKKYHASIKVEHRKEAIQWLVDEEYGALIKSLFIIPLNKDSLEDAKELADMLESKGFSYEKKEDIHAMTLKSLAKDRSESGKPLPTELFGVFVCQEAIIKPSKNK